MFTAASTYLLMVVLIWWAYCGYIWLLFLFHVIRPATPPTAAAEAQPPRDLEQDCPAPLMAVFVPCYNELGLVQEKVRNTLALEYPRHRLRVYFLNGRSTDGTGEALALALAGVEGFHAVETRVSGKINQLNAGLAMLPPDVDIVLNTDMDALLEPDVLARVAQAFRDGRVGVVGANIRPGDCISIEKNYWEGQNTLRILESAVHTSSIVVAPCYAFRRTVLSAFPDDCVADDIYVAFKANTMGLRTRYLAEAKGRELRCPSSLEDFLGHKFRKGNAFLQELLRVLYRLPQMSPWWKVIYLTKLLQVAVIPWVLPYFGLATLSFLLSGGGMLNMAVLCCGLLAASMVIASVSVNRFKAVHFNGSRQRGILVPFLIANLIMVLVGLTYALYRQDSSYKKIGEGCDG